MRGSWVLLRAALGLMTAFFAHNLGQSWARVRKGTARTARLIMWSARLTLALGAVWFAGGFDVLGTVVYIAAAIALALGFYFESRPKRDGELTKVMFPDAK